MELKKVNFEVVTEFENKIAEFFGAPYAVAVDSCTHGIELCLRLTKANHIVCPKHTYLSIPMLADKLNIKLYWKDDEWKDYYFVANRIYDAAVLWKRDSYVRHTFMCISFQFQKHLSLGRGGIILCDSQYDYMKLKKMSYDGRLPGIPWRSQDMSSMGYHYYMTPETAQLGLDKLQQAIDTEPRQWTTQDWPDLTKLTVFKK
jgi:dTDP-4-amino-4,6-dideoxygalactose transaminase